MTDQLRSGCQSAARPALNKGDAAPRRFVLVLRLPVSGAMGKAETAFNAEIGIVDEVGGVQNSA